MPYTFFTEEQHHWCVPSRILSSHYLVLCSLPLYRPGHGDRKLVLFAQYFHEVLPAWWADGPQRVRTSF